MSGLPVRAHARAASARARGDAALGAAWAAHRAGDHASAVSACRALLSNGVRSVGVLHLLGVGLSLLGDQVGALQALDEAIGVDPALALLRFTRGQLHLKARRFPAALEDFRATVEAEPTHSEASLLAARLSLSLGFHAEAARHATRAVELDDRSALAHRYLGIALAEAGRSRDALAALRRAVDLDPADQRAWTEMGEVLLRLGKVEPSGRAFAKAIGLDRSAPGPHIGLARCLMRAGHGPQAMRKLREALSETGRSSRVLLAMGNLLRDLGQLDDARDCFAEIIAARSDADAARYNLARLEFECFRFREAWSLMGARWDSLKHASKALSSPHPVWTGARDGGPLLVWGEQGLGDQVLFSTILPDLAEIPREKFVAIDRRLVPLFERSLGSSSMRFISRAAAPPPGDYTEHVAIGDLGRFFRNSVEDFRKRAQPLLRADRSRIARYAAEMRRTPTTLVCGLAWRSKNVRLADEKSLGGKELHDLVVGMPCRFVNLQYGDVQLEIQSMRGFGVDLAELEGLDLKDDIDGLAAAIMACDVVLTTSNSTAHIAGALGKRTLLLLPNGRGQFWYWQPFGEGSIWYPSVRLLRQHTARDWSVPIAEARRRLNEGNP